MKDDVERRVQAKIEAMLGAATEEEEIPFNDPPEPEQPALMNVPEPEASPWIGEGGSSYAD